MRSVFTLVIIGEISPTTKIVGIENAIQQTNSKPGCLRVTHELVSGCIDGVKMARVIVKDFRNRDYPFTAHGWFDMRLDLPSPLIFFRFRRFVTLAPRENGSLLKRGVQNAGGVHCSGQQGGCVLQETREKGHGERARPALLERELLEDTFV